MKEITKKQRKVYQFILGHLIEYHSMPTIRDIQLHFGYKSTGTVREYIHALEMKGYIERTQGLSRGLKLLNVRLRIEGGLDEH